MVLTNESNVTSPFLVHIVFMSSLWFSAQAKSFGWMLNKNDKGGDGLKGKRICDMIVGTWFYA